MFTPKTVQGLLEQVEENDGHITKIIPLFNHTVWNGRNLIGLTIYVQDGEGFSHPNDFTFRRLDAEDSYGWVRVTKNPCLAI